MNEITKSPRKEPRKQRDLWIEADSEVFSWWFCDFIHRVEAEKRGRGDLILEIALIADSFSATHSIETGR